MLCNTHYNNCCDKRVNTNWTRNNSFICYVIAIVSYPVLSYIILYCIKVVLFIMEILYCIILFFRVLPPRRRTSTRSASPSPAPMLPTSRRYAPVWRPSAPWARSMRKAPSDCPRKSWGSLSERVLAVRVPTPLIDSKWGSTRGSLTSPLPLRRSRISPTWTSLLESTWRSSSPRIKLPRIKLYERYLMAWCLAALLMHWLYCCNS